MTFINPQYLVETAWLEAHLNDPDPPLRQLFQVWLEWRRLVGDPHPGFDPAAGLHLSGMQREKGKEGFGLFSGKADGPSRGEPRLERAEQDELQRRHDDRGL